MTKHQTRWRYWIFVVQTIRVIVQTIGDIVQTKSLKQSGGKSGETIKIPNSVEILEVEQGKDPRLGSRLTLSVSSLDIPQLFLLRDDEN